MSILLMAAASLLATDAHFQQSERRQRTRRSMLEMTDSEAYPRQDLLAGQPNQFPGVDWSGIEIRQVDATAFPGVDWQPAGHCQGRNGQVGYVYRARGNNHERPTEEVSFYYQKILFAQAPSGDGRGVHQPGSGATGATRRRGVERENIGSDLSATANAEAEVFRQDMGQVQSPRRTAASVQWPYQLSAADIASSNHCPS
jgi:hypothetical protein